MLPNAHCLLALQGIVAADAPLEMLISGMAQDGVEAAAAEAAYEPASEGSSGGAGDSDSEGGGEGTGSASSPGESGSTVTNSQLVATCLLLLSMVRSAYISGRAQPAAAFLRRVAQLASEGSEASWFAQLLLRPALLLLSKVLPTTPLVRGRAAAGG